MRISLHHTRSSVSTTDSLQLEGSRDGERIRLQLTALNSSVNTGRVFCLIDRRRRVDGRLLRDRSRFRLVVTVSDADTFACGELRHSTAVRYVGALPVFLTVRAANCCQAEPLFSQSMSGLFCAQMTSVIVTWGSKEIVVSPIVLSPATATTWYSPGCTRLRFPRVAEMLPVSLLLGPAGVSSSRRSG